MLNSFVFLLIGLDLPEIIDSLKADGVSLWTAVGYGVLVTAALIVCRLLYAYAAVVVSAKQRKKTMIEKEIIYHYIHRIDLEEERMLKE